MLLHFILLFLLISSCLFLSCFQLQHLFTQPRIEQGLISVLVTLLDLLDLLLEYELTDELVSSVLWMVVVYTQDVASCRSFILSSVMCNYVCALLNLQIIRCFPSPSAPYFQADSAQCTELEQLSCIVSQYVRYFNPLFKQ